MSLWRNNLVHGSHFITTSKNSNNQYYSFSDDKICSRWMYVDCNSKDVVNQSNIYDSKEASIKVVVIKKCIWISWIHIWIPSSIIIWNQYYLM